MCTAITYNNEDFYFGRTLDYEFSYGEKITITPRNYNFKYKNKENISNHYAIIGMAHIANDYPLYYEAVNEQGLGIAGLNFVGNAYYNDKIENKDNIAQFEFIPWILCQCKNVEEARTLLQNINITNESFSNDYPIAQLHWIISDNKECIVVESVKSGLNIYANPVGVLTNNPSFDKQIFSLNNYRNLSVEDKENTFSKNIDLKSKNTPHLN